MSKSLVFLLRVALKKGKSHVWIQAYTSRTLTVNTPVLFGCKDLPLVRFLEGRWTHLKKQWAGSESNCRHPLEVNQLHPITTLVFKLLGSTRSPRLSKLLHSKGILLNARDENSGPQRKLFGNPNFTYRANYSLAVPTVASESQPGLYPVCWWARRYIS